jgi:hypothetical protein
VLTRQVLGKWSRVRAFAAWKSFMESGLNHSDFTQNVNDRQPLVMMSFIKYLGQG